MEEQRRNAEDTSARQESPEPSGRSPHYRRTSAFFTVLFPTCAAMQAARALGFSRGPAQVCSPKSFAIRSYEKCAHKSFAMRIYKNKELKTSWNEHLQKKPGWGALVRAAPTSRLRMKGRE